MMYNNGGYYYGYSHMLGWGIFGAVLMVLFWVFVIVLIVRAVRWLVSGSQWHRKDWHNWREMVSGHSGLNILNERYARGEINKAEYEEKKKDLMS